jgi:hypothetical protein
MLLDLYAHRDKKTKGPDLALRLLKISKQDFTARATKLRDQITRLRTVLATHNEENPDQPWTFSLDLGSRSTGYQLTVSRGRQTPSKNFWSPHLIPSKESPVICDPLLFFYDHASTQVTRFMDTNIDTPSLSGALAQLKLKHEAFYKETLTPGHLYLDIGSFNATERLRAWFSRNSDKYLPVRISYETNSKDVFNTCPIFIGSIRTNVFLRNFYASPAARKLAYRLHPEKYAFATVAGPKERDIRVLSQLGLEVSDNVGILTTPRRELTLGHITRVPNPGGAGHMTIITSDATYAVDKMAEAVCSDEHLAEIFRQTGWPADEPLPDSFEWLFLIRLWPAGNADEAKKPELLTWRMPRPPDVV